MAGERRDVDRLATVLYSYSLAAPSRPQLGQASLPTGAMLTHHNLLSNLESLRQIFRVTREDCVLGLLPFSQLDRLHRHPPASRADGRTRGVRDWSGGCS